MKFYKILSISICAFLVSCVTKVPLNTSYFANSKKVGFILKVDSPTRTGMSGGEFGAIGALVGSLAEKSNQKGGKYQEALELVDTIIKPKDKLKDFYITLFKNKGKDIHYINDSLKFTNLKDFKAPSKEKKYFYKDLRFLNEIYSVDEILLVIAEYGINSQYSYGIEVGRNTWFNSMSIIVDLKDNSYFYSGGTYSADAVKGKWKTPPKYENLVTHFENNLLKHIKKESIKLQGSSITK